MSDTEQGGGLALTDEDLAIAIAGPADAIDVEVLDADVASAEIVARILSATSEDEVAAVAEKGTTRAEDVVGLPLVIQAVRFGKSGFENGPAVYALMECVEPQTGERLTVTCGSRNVMAALLKLKQLDALPTKVPWTIKVADKASAGGYYPMWLVKAPGE